MLDQAVGAIIEVALMLAEEIKDEIVKQKMLNYIESLEKYIKELEQGISNRNETIKLLRKEMSRLKELVAQTGGKV